MSVSTFASSSAMPFSAICMRFLPSNANGFVTTAIVSAPDSRASSAIPAKRRCRYRRPYPPSGRRDRRRPRSMRDLLRCLGSLAPERRICAGTEAARLAVADVTRLSVSAPRSACTSELTAKKSTPLSPAAIMRLTALQPPPPTPTTLMVAACSGSNVERRPSAIASVPSVKRSVLVPKICQPSLDPRERRASSPPNARTLLLVRRLHRRAPDRSPSRTAAPPLSVKPPDRVRRADSNG